MAITSDFVLPAGQLRSWVEEHARLSADIAALEEKRDALQKRIEAVKMLFGSGAAPDIGDEGGGQTVIGFVSSFLADKKAGVTLAEVGEAIEGSALAEKYYRNRNALYTAVSRLTERNEIIRHGKLLYTPTTFARVANGELPDPRYESGGEEITVPDLILAALRSAGKALSPGAILDEVRKNDAAAEKMQRNPQYGYTVLGRMNRRGQIEKRGKLYALPGTPDGGEDDIPEDVRDLL